MISKAYISLLQLLFLVLKIDAMPESFPRDTTDSPNDQKDLKEMESSGEEALDFQPHPPYQSNVFSFRRVSEKLPDFPYHLDRLGNSGSSWDLNSDGSVTALAGHGDVFAENSDMPKRGNGPFKQGIQKFRFDPALNRLGLGKRDSSDRPKYNPGWKFIGLGKRIMPFFHSLNPSGFNVDRMDRKDFVAGTPDALIPYYRMLAAPDISIFLDDVKERLQGNPRRNNRSHSSTPDHFPLGLYSAAGTEETSPKVKHSMTGFLAMGPQSQTPERSNKPQLFFTRSRKPTSMWRNKSKPMYDPGWLMTGLGK